MKKIFKTLALGLMLMTVVSCEKHDLFDENTITGAVGPETYWTIESSMVKSGESMGFVGQYYSTVAKIDHSEVWYELFEKEDKLVTASLIKAFTYSYTSNTTTQKRMLQTIQSYPHSEDLWNDSLRAYVLEDRFPVSTTLSPISWAQPKELTGFDKNLHAYFSDTFAVAFKEGLTKKMHSHDGPCDTVVCHTAHPHEEKPCELEKDTVRNYAAYMQVFQGLGLLETASTYNNKDTVSYLQWMTDSTFDKNSSTWKKHFKQYDSVFSTTNFETRLKIDTTFKVTGRPPKRDTTWFYDTTYYDVPLFDSMRYVYPEIVEKVDQVWNDSVSFYQLIQGADGYSIEYQRSYYINAELRIYDEHGNYSKTDSKEIGIN